MGEYDDIQPTDVVRAPEVSANIDFIYITVDDMARSLTFYEHLGFKFPTEAYNQLHVEAETKNGLRIFWNHIDYVRIFTPDYRPAPHGRVGLAFQQESRAAVDTVFYKLQRLGYRVDRTPWDSAWGHHYAIVYDPDGSSIYLFARHV